MRRDTCFLPPSKDLTPGVGYSLSMCRPKRVGFLPCFGLKTGIDFAHFGLESGMVFEGTTGVYECIYRFYTTT